jgi:hypothetical protein
MMLKFDLAKKERALAQKLAQKDDQGKGKAS